MGREAHDAAVGDRGALIVGGVVMGVIELLPLNVTTRCIERITWKQRWASGRASAGALFPGTSRSAATIMAGLVAGLSRPAAAEFSFFAILAMKRGLRVQAVEVPKAGDPARPPDAAADHRDAHAFSWPGR